MGWAVQGPSCPGAELSGNLYRHMCAGNEFVNDAHLQWRQHKQWPKVGVTVSARHFHANKTETWSSQCLPNSSDRQDKYVIGPICLISSRTEMSDVAYNTMYTVYTQNQTDISSVLWNDSPNRTECPMKFHNVLRTLSSAYIVFTLSTCSCILDLFGPFGEISRK